MSYKNSTPPISCDLQMFRLMIIYSLCFMIDKAHGHFPIARVALGYRVIPCPLFWGCRYTLQLYLTLKFEFSPNGDG